VAVPASFTNSHILVVVAVVWPCIGPETKEPLAQRLYWPANNKASAKNSNFIVNQRVLESIKLGKPALSLLKLDVNKPNHCFLDANLWG
jgi:hypothetical protein